jgi:hypothetical protein
MIDFFFWYSPALALHRANRGGHANRLSRLVIKLHQRGVLQTRYSVHDLRQTHAVPTYKATHEVYRVQKALGHANVAVTEKYLKCLETVRVGCRPVWTSEGGSPKKSSILFPGHHQNDVHPFVACRLAGRKSNCSKPELRQS